MPGPAAHNVIGWKLAAEFDRRASDDAPAEHREPLREAAKIIREYPAHVALGSQGPDVLFFSLADWRGVPSNVPKLMIEVTDKLRSVRHELYDALPVIEEMHELADELEEESHVVQEFKRLTTTLRGFSEAIAETIMSGIKSVLLDEIDPYSFLNSPIQKCKDESNWWWFDTLHYRKTGEFVKELLARAGDIDDSVEAQKLHAYAIGYLSHVAGDTIGHPYVNTTVRGPYRTHAKRHKTIENYQDAWLYAKYHGEEPDHFGVHHDIIAELRREDRRRGLFDEEGLADLTSSRLHQRQHLMTSHSTKHVQETALPEYVAETFEEAARDVFGGERARDEREWTTSRLTADDVDNAYRLWYRWFRSATETGTLDPELPEYEPPSSPIQEKWEQFLEDVADAVTSIWNALQNLFDNGLSGEPDFDGLMNILEKLGEVAISGLLLAVTTLDWLLSQLLRIPTELLQLLLEGVYQALYAAYESFHEMVALLGFGYPLKHQILRKETRHFIFPSEQDGLGQAIDHTRGGAEEEWGYPMGAVGETGGPSLEFDDPELASLDRTAHLVFPSGLDDSNLETVGDDYGDDEEGYADPAPPRPVTGPDKFEAEWPAYYIDGRSLFEHVNRTSRPTSFAPDTSIEDILGDPEPEDRTITGVDSTFLNNLGAIPNEEPDAIRSLGKHDETPATAVGLTAKLYAHWTSGKELPDVNLDGDRGFGYGTWIAKECEDEIEKLDKTVSPKDTEGSS